MKALSILLLTGLIITSSCKDDDYSQQLEYTICVDEIVLDENRLSQENIELVNWPNEIRSFFSSEFSGFTIATMKSYKDIDNTKYFLLEATNGGQLLFDQSYTFICGDDTFQMESGRGDDYIALADLPQSILDYIEANYPGIEISEAEFEDGEYEVKLKNGVELCFDQAGNYKGGC